MGEIEIYIAVAVGRYYLAFTPATRKDACRLVYFKMYISGLSGEMPPRTFYPTFSQAAEKVHVYNSKCQISGQLVDFT